MASVTKPPETLGRPPTKRDTRTEKQLRRDRWTAVIVLAVIAALMALTIWLASLSGGPVEPIDYWPMMP